MSWQNVNFDWNQARAFLATLEEGSLSAAARALAQTQPTLGRQIAALEASLGVVLFERVGRRWVVTPTGEKLAQHVRVMQEAALQMSLTASSQSETAEGLVRITASDIYATYLLPEFLVQLQQIAPKISIDVIADNAIQDLQRREADIAIRHVRPEQPELVTRMIGQDTAQLYAASTYFENHPRPRSPEDMADHIFISLGDTQEMIRHLQHMNLNLTEANFKLHSDVGVVGWEMVRAGLGILVMSDTVAARCEGLEVVLPQTKPVTFPTWLTTHRELHTNRRIRVVFDALADFFGGLF